MGVGRGELWRVGGAVGPCEVILNDEGDVPYEHFHACSQKCILVITKYVFYSH